MADQKRWFKVWTSVVSDDDFDPSRPGGLLSLGRFSILGAYTALHGVRGRVTVMTDTLLRLLQAPDMSTIRGDLAFKNVLFEEGKNSHGKLTVTWQKWARYQEDTTWRERKALSRVQRREEEKRREERKRDKKTTTPPSPSPPAEEVSWGSPEALIKIYNDHAPDECPAVETLSPARRKKAALYLRQFPRQEFWEEAFQEIHKSTFLRGLKPSPGHENFRADLDWLLSKGKDGTENVVKVMEGKYRDAEKR